MLGVLRAVRVFFQSVETGIVEADAKLKLEPHAMHLTRLEREDPEPSGLAVEPALKDVGSLCERNQGQVSEP